MGGVDCAAGFGQRAGAATEMGGLDFVTGFEGSGLVGVGWG